MVAINKILLLGCTGEGCGGETGTCTDSPIHRGNAEDRAPTTRNRCRGVNLGRWLTRDPIGYRGGINLYGFVNSSPVGNVDADGLGCWVTFSCALYKSQLANSSTRICSYICNELGRVTMLLGDNTTCADMPKNRVVTRFDKQEWSFWNWITFGHCGSPAHCPRNLMYHQMYSDLAKQLPVCSRRKCRNDCGLAYAIAKRACGIAKSKVAVKGCVLAAGAAYTVCVSTCDAFCKQP